MEKEKCLQLKTRLNNIELSSKKRNANFIEKLFRYLKFDFDHDTYKDIINERKEPNNDCEKRMKIIYDAYIYLISNRKCEFSESLIKRFYYLLTSKEIDHDIVFKLQSLFYRLDGKGPISKTLEMYYAMYQFFINETKELQNIIAVMMLNYMLIRFEIIPIVLYVQDYEKLNDIKIAYEKGDYALCEEFLINQIFLAGEKSKMHCNTKSSLTCEEICQTIRDKKEIITNMFHIKSLALFGSFAKGRENINSDIDLAVEFDDDITYATKLKCRDEMVEYLFYKFDRFVDIQEVGPYIFKELIYGLKNYIKIF